jgi:uncharacterized membrane protein
MNYSSTELKQISKNQMSGRYGLLIPFTLLYSIIVYFITAVFDSPINIFTDYIELRVDHSYRFILFYLIILFLATVLISFISSIITCLFEFGYLSFYLKFCRNQNPSYHCLTEGFNICPGKMIATTLLISLFTFFWSLLFIIPGIIKSLSYSQAIYILIDHPEKSPLEVIRDSQAMMDGYKGDLFYLQLSFIGWILLAIPTCGLLFLWLQPYMQCTYTNFYLDRSGFFNPSSSYDYENDTAQDSNFSNF